MKVQDFADQLEAMSLATVREHHENPEAMAFVVDRLVGALAAVITVGTRGDAGQMMVVGAQVINRLAESCEAGARDVERERHEQGRRH